MPEYGHITRGDAGVIEDSLITVSKAFPERPLHILEIGVLHGKTSNGIKQFLDSNGISFKYWGVDSDRDVGVAPPFPDAALIKGDSSVVHRKVPNGFHWMFIDGCHCLNHAMLDFLNYSNKLHVGGLLVFHDTKLSTQGVHDYQGHGEVDNPDSHISVRPAMKKLGLLDGYRSDWELFVDAPGDDSWGGGVTIFKRIKE